PGDGTAGVSTARTRRGRPPGPVTDQPAPHGYHHNPETRVGWLLRGWRLATMPGSNARRFAELLNARGISADASRVSRWETGVFPAPIEVVEGYEDLLGLPAGGILGATTFQRRLASGDRRQRINYGPDRIQPDRLEQVLDTVYAGSPTGRDWFELGMTASTLQEQLVLPRTVWDTITARLVNEVGRAVGNAYIARIECAILFTAHPGAARALVRAIGEHVTSPDSLLVTDPMSLLQEIDGPQANDLVLRLLEQPTPLVRNAAAWACAGKVVRGHFGDAELERLERILARAVPDQGLDGGGSVSRLRDLVEVLPEPGRTRLLRLSHEHGHHLDQGEEPAGTDLVEEVAHEIGSRPLPDGAGAEDPMYPSLVERALLDEHAERRFLAAFTLKVSARRGHAAAACTEHLRRHLDDEALLDQECLHRLMVLLSIVAEDAEHDMLLRLAGGEVSSLQAMAVASLAHLPPSRRVQLPDLAELVHSDDDAVARSALYCAGMTLDAVLDRVVDDVRLPDWKRRSARWWRTQPGAIHEPAVQES
ncbi:MAG: hypothetical protein ACXVYS_18745, partial [Oryzihumus sp.]